mgnify:FL=1
MQMQMLISYINLSSGQVVIKYNDVVKKGDLIATSNLQYLDNLYSRDKMVPLVGEILGNVKEYYEIEVLKNEEVEFFNGNKQQFYTLDFSKKILFSKTYYNLSTLCDIPTIITKRILNFYSILVSF